jgi:hypothetical protein
MLSRLAEGDDVFSDDARDEAEMRALQLRDWCTAYEEEFPAQFAAMRMKAQLAMRSAIAGVVCRGPVA